MARRQYEVQKHIQEPVAYTVSANPDIMYLHEAMKAPNRDQFKRTMDKELQDHITLQTLGGSSQKRRAKRDESTGYGVGYVMQEMDRQTQSLQMKGTSQHTWWAATTWHQLLGNLCSSHNMADHPLLLRIGNHQRMAEPTNRFHVGIYASPR